MSEPETYYQRNRERILERAKEWYRENKDKKEYMAKMRENSKNYFMKNMKIIKQQRLENREEINDKQREAYRESVRVDYGHIVVPTAKKIDATGLEMRNQRRLISIGDTMHKRHVIQRQLEINRLKAEAFKKILSAENNL